MCLKSGKFLGEDGFTVEFYKFFFKLIHQEFINNINASFKDNEQVAHHTS